MAVIVGILSPGAAAKDSATYLDGKDSSSPVQRIIAVLDDKCRDVAF